MATVVLLCVLVVAAGALLGAAAYESAVVDPVWPGRPGMVAPRHGGLSRRRFWTPAYAVFEGLLLIAVFVTLSDPAVRTALLVALGAQLVLRIWSLFDLAPRSAEVENADPADVDPAAAAAWTRRALGRLPLLGLTCAALLTALVSV